MFNAKNPFRGAIEILDITCDQDIQNCIDEFRAVGATDVKLVERNRVTKSAKLMVTTPHSPEEFRRRLGALGGGCF